jgi:uncharacterized membrane protein YcaP (DUF421 family)
MELVLRATVIYWILWLIFRGTGKRSLADLSPLELLVTIVIGDIVQQGVTQEDMSVTGGVIVVCTFVTWTILGDWIARRSVVAERILDGRAVVILTDGVADAGRLRIERLTEDDVRAAAREAGFDDLAKVRVAVLESDGKFSFIGDPEGAPVSTSPSEQGDTR